MNEQQIPQLQSHPNVVAFELTNDCNSRCIFCPLFHGPERMDRSVRPKAVMTMPLFEALVQELAGWEKKPETIYLNLHGEPLLDPGFRDKLELLQRVGLADRVDLQTNGSFLSPETAQALVAAPVRRVTLGFDGATPKVYALHRRGCDYDQVLANVKHLAQCRDQADSPMKIAVQYVQTTKNEHEVFAAYTLFRQFLSPRKDCFQTTVSNSWARDFLTDDGVILKYAEGGVPTQPCPLVFSQMMITVDGRVAACCWDYNLQIGGGALGDVAAASMLEVWRGENFQHLRGVLGGLDPAAMPPICRQCPRQYANKGGEAAARVSANLAGLIPAEKIMASCEGTTLYF